MKEGGDGAGVVDHDLAAQALALLVPGALDRQQVGMGAGSDQTKGRMRGRHGQCRRRRAVAEQPARLRLRQQEPRGAVGEGGLADAGGTGQQPGVRQPLGVVGADERLLRGFVAREFRVFARRGRVRPFYAGFSVVRDFEVVAHRTIIPQCRTARAPRSRRRRARSRGPGSRRPRRSVRARIARSPEIPASTARGTRVRDARNGSGCVRA